MVRAVRENGLLQFATVGGVWETQLLSQRLRLETGDGRSYTGAMVADSPKQIGPTQETVLQYSLGDFGFSSADEAYQAGVLEGDMVTLQCPFTVLNGGKRLLAKAWDDRYGCILGVELLQLLKDIELPFDLYVGANAQEEVWACGAPARRQLWSGPTWLWYWTVQRPTMCMAFKRPAGGWARG